MPIIPYHYEHQEALQCMMEILKKQTECVTYTTNLYSHNAQLLAIATHSLSIELSLLNLLEASTREECDAPWKQLDVCHWKEFLNHVDLDSFWNFYELTEFGMEYFPQPTEFDIKSTLMCHHVTKEREDGRAFYDLKEDGFRDDNANALDFALQNVASMSPSYAAEVAEDAILQLEATFVELEKLMKENTPEGVQQMLEKRSKAGRKAVSCFKPQVSIEDLQEAFYTFMQSIRTDDNRIRLGNMNYDRKYVFVLLYYRLQRAGVVYSKLNVSDYSRFIHNALGLSEVFASFRKSMNNWMQKIDLYECSFYELTPEMLRNRKHEQQLTPDEYEVWCVVDKELEKAIDRSGALDGFL